MAFQFEQRLEPSKAIGYLIPPASVFLSLIVGGLILLGAGANPITAYREMFTQAFGTYYGLSETLVKATPLMLSGLGVTLAFRMLFWNIGAEGQLHMGAYAATALVLLDLRWSGWALLPAMMAAGMVAGAFWGLIPALLKAKLNVNEIITTLLLNYVAILWVDYLVYGPWKDPLTLNFPLTRLFPEEAQLPRLGDTRVHLGLLFAVVLGVLLYFIQERSRWGYEIRVIGENPRAARYGGIRIGRNIVLVMLISGALSGLAGMAEVSGIQHRLLHGISPGYGYTAIIVAWLAKLNPWAVMLVAVLLGGLFVGGEVVQISMKLPVSLIFIIQGAILFFVLGGEILTRYRLVWRREEVALGPR